ncbi:MULTISPECIES: DUF5316 family protein [Bacillus]|uniref:DUF5316 family protein n=1 Tax=Bacillus TaxID=1386 RepID=UPI000419CF77|nr:MULTISPECIES: DUF5316 family protein [Bacillus]QHZ45452.1 DUF5316 domain-containing protein [Bacillus sp. NSP9.1]WFA04748.1 DUF5316 family protein [Bacillus sp. HSf4]
MKKAFLSGIIVCFAAALISAVAGDWTFIYKISGTAGLGSMILSALLSFVSGDRFGGRDGNGKMTNGLAVFALPNLLAAGISLFFAF